MKIYLKIALVALALLLQLTLINLISLQGLKPDLILLVVVVFSLMGGAEEGCVSGFAAGLLQDIFSSGLLGVNALAKTVIGFSCGILRNKVFPEHFSSFIPLIAFIASLGHSLIIFFVLRAFGVEYTLSWSLKQIILPEALFNSLLSPLVLLIITRVLK